MVDPTLTISIAGSPALVLSALGSDGTALGIVSYTEPALQPRIQYAPESRDMHGDLALGWTWQQTILGFDVAPNGPASEDAAQAALDALRDAITQALEFGVTVTKNGGTPQVWTCNPGSLVPAGGRSRVDLARSVPVWSVSLPAFPVRG